DGQAKEGSLRETEVTVPLTLYSQVSSFPGRRVYIDALESCMGFIKELGTNRNRGMGRCKFSSVKVL
ncbi:MAG: hypothetical protein AAFR59_17810, partial [Bacteroidota bacterium]